MLRHPRLSAVVAGGIAMVVIAVRLGSESGTPVGVFLIASLGIVIGAGWYLGMKLSPRLH
jgi:hypothetical protein